MRDYKQETINRVNWIKEILKTSGAKGIIFGSSGGKDSVLVGILCRKATENVLGVIMPCGSKQNFGSDKEDALKIAEQFDIKTICVDLTSTKEELTKSIEQTITLEHMPKCNINPRLRMTTLYSIGQTLGYLVCGTGNRSETYMGYFTKWGDGAFDLNPIVDLTVTEIFEFLRYLEAPREIIEKAPSAGLFEGQTDEQEMGVSYSAIDEYITKGTGTENDVAKIKRANAATEHKRRPANIYGN